MLTKDTAICIRTVDYSETSQIVTFFTREAGKISAIAKGSKRPKSAFDGPIEIFSYGKIVFSDSNREKLATLTEFESAYGGPGFAHLADEFFTFNCVSFAAELVNLLTDEYDPHPGLFDGLLQFLQNVNEGRGIPASAGTGLPLRRQGDEGRRTLALLILFQLALLKEVGLQPILNACANCKTRYEHRASRASTELSRMSIEHRVYFSSAADGLVCRDCEASFPDKISITAPAANCLADVKLIAEADGKILDEIEKILIYHFTETLGRPPKMAKYILKNQPDQSRIRNG